MSITRAYAADVSVHLKVKLSSPSLCTLSFLPPFLWICLLHLSPYHQASLQVITEDECQLWWAAKEMQRGKKLQDYVGKNEKTKLVVKIQKVRAIPAKLTSSIFVLLYVFVINCFPFVAVPVREGRGHQQGSL